MKKLVASALVTGILALAGTAQASFHLTKIVEVCPGTTATPTAQYVVLQFHAAGQNFLAGHDITLYDATGTLLGTSTFVGSPAVPDGSDQAKVLIGSSTVTSEFGVVPNLTLVGTIPLAGGKICFDAVPEDCFSWGNYTGNDAGVGQNFPALQLDHAAKRKLDIVAPNNTLQGTGGPASLGDDTDNSATDFVDSNTPTPVRNGPPPSVDGGVDGGGNQDAGGTDSGSNPGNDAGSTAEAGTTTDSGSTNPGTDSGGTGTGNNGTADAGRTPTPRVEEEDSGCAVTSGSELGMDSLVATGLVGLLLLKRRRNLKKK